jgi:hypothetical protein
VHRLYLPLTFIARMGPGVEMEKRRSKFFFNILKRNLKLG